MANLGWWIDKFMENYAIMPSLKGIGVKKRNFLKFSLGKDFSESVYDCDGQGCRIISIK